MDLRKLKEGTALRYKTGFLSKKWKECYLVLYSDSSLCWYGEKGDSRPDGSVLLKDVVPYICIGLVCDRMPVKRPQVPRGYSVHHLVGIGMDPQASKVHWLLFSSDSDLESWFQEIAKTLPKPENPPQLPPQPNTGGNPPQYNPPPVYPAAPPTANSNYQGRTNGYAPAPNYGGGPPSSYGGDPGYGRPAYGGPGSYGAPQTTVIVQDRGYGGSSGLGFGSGMGTGLLMGSLMGYGLGSFWGGGLYPSYGFGGHGFGGGYVQDNDTYITNNYYGGGPDSNVDGSGADGQGLGDSGNQMPDVTDNQDWSGGGNVADYGDQGDFDGGTFGDGDFGGGDFGGGDFGGGDFGGGDFGGGDFGGGDF